MRKSSEKEPRPEKIGKEVVEKLYAEKREALEKKELLTEREKIVREKLEKEVVKMKLSPQMKAHAQKKAQQIKNLDEKGKLKHLLDLAEKRGVSFAVGVAKDMKDPYTLDVFHDILAREGLYKKFRK